MTKNALMHSAASHEIQPLSKMHRFPTKQASISSHLHGLEDSPEPVMTFQHSERPDIDTPTFSPSPQLTSTFSDISISTQSIEGNPSSYMKDSSTSDQESSHTASLVANSNPRSHSQTTNDVKQILATRMICHLNQQERSTILLLDLRGSAQYNQARVSGAINLSIPVTLLKRSAYTIAKIAASLDDAGDRKRLSEWFNHTYIFIYDNDSFNVGLGSNLNQFATKFIHSKLTPHVFTVKGGFNAICKLDEKLVDRRTPVNNLTSMESAREPDDQQANSMAGLGDLCCVLPAKTTAVNPFYNNIRQNQDLIGGVGEPIPMQIPNDLSSNIRALLPLWLRRLAFTADGPQLVADKFLVLEQEEQTRMQRVLKAGACFKTDPSEERHSVAAGVERGDKNRYNNIWPFEHARVHLGQLHSDAAEYINASHLHVEDTEKQYIATQGPLPSTTKDFWQMVWENEIQTIVMLTQTVEGGQAKCHSYWDASEPIKPYRLEFIETFEKRAQYGPSIETPLTIRKFMISNDAQTLCPARKLTHIQLHEWPDFHVIKPESILALIQEVNNTEIDRTPAMKRRKSVSQSIGCARGRNPILSHCSAGCGRTGVFCTVDTVMDLVAQQLTEAQPNSRNHEIDLVERTVRGFRDQRLSMVQT